MKNLLTGKMKLFSVIAGIIIILSVASVVFGKLYRDSMAHSFDKGGYVVLANELQESSKHQFNVDQKLEKSLSGAYSFTDNENQSVTLSADNFVFYDDDSMTSLSKGVLLNIMDIAQVQYVNHYALSPYMEVKPVGSGYEIENDGDPVQLNEVLWKISDTKYLLLSKNIKVKFAEDDIREVKNYLQINYIDEGVIQLITEDNLWQTVSSTITAETQEGAILHLADQVIEYKGTKMLMSKLVVDSDANIELSPLETKSQIIPEFDIDSVDGESGESGTDGMSGHKGGSGIHGNTGEDGEDGDSGSDGDVGKDGEDGEDITFESTFKTQLPTITLTSWKVNATEIEAEYHVEDPNEMMDDNESLTILLYEAGSDQVIKCVDSLTGLSDNSFVPYQDMKFKNDTILKPDTEYRLVISGKYHMNGTYEREFLSRVFYTDSLGVLIEKESVTTNEVAIKISKKDYSKATRATVYLLTEEEAKDSFDLNRNYKKQEMDLSNVSTLSDTVTFTSNVEPNKKYVARLSVTLSNGKTYLSEQVVPLTTLKRVPVLNGTPVANANRKSYGFELYGGSVRDDDKAIISYKYEVYDDNGNMVRQFDVTPSETNQATMLYIDGTQIKAGEQYYFRVKALYNDNEKIVELNSPISPNFVMYGSQLPALTYQPNSTQHESLRGYLVIDTNGCDFDVTEARPMTVHIDCEGVYQKAYRITNIGTTNSSSAWVSGSQIMININEMGLSEGKLYRFSVSAWFNMHDDPSLQYVDSFSEKTIGHVVNKTNDIMTFQAIWSTARTNNDALLATNLRMVPYSESTEGNTTTTINEEAKTLTRVDIELLSATDKTKVIGKTTLEDTNAECYESDLLTKLTSSDGVDISEDTFHVDPSVLNESAYIIRISGAYDYTVNSDTDYTNGAKVEEYVNEFNVISSEKDVTLSSRPPALPEVAKLNSQILATAITNANVERYDNTQTKDLKLNENTIVGYNLDFAYNNATRLAKKVHVYVFKSEDVAGNNLPSLIYNQGLLNETNTNENDRKWLERIVLDVNPKEYNLPKLNIFFGGDASKNVTNDKAKDMYYSQVLERGQDYTFVYAVEYQLEEETTVNVYPYHHPDFNQMTAADQSKYILNSGSKETPKNEPIFVGYPTKEYIANENGVDVRRLKVKIAYSDPDGTVYQEGEDISGTYLSQITSNNGEVKNIKVEDSSTIASASLKWQELDYDLSTLSANALSLNVDWYPYDSDSAKNTQKNKGNISFSLDRTNVVVPEGLGISLQKEEDKNALSYEITATDPQVLEAFRERITIVKMVFTSANGKTATVWLSPNYDTLGGTISYASISKLIHDGDITVQSYIYYDTGLQGWDYTISDGSNPAAFALQLGGGNYLRVNSVTGALEVANNSIGSAYVSNSSLDLLSFDSEIPFALAPINSPNTRTTFKAMASNQGVSLNGTTGSNLTLVKQLGTQQVSDINLTEITNVIPAASATGYEPYLSSVDINYLRFYGIDSITPAADGKRHVTLKFTSMTGTSHTVTKDIILDDHITAADETQAEFSTYYVDGLRIGTKYSVTAFANIGGVEKQLLNFYASDGRVFAMEIKTANQVAINNPLVKVDNTMYGLKTLTLTYSLDQLKGFKIQYALYTKNEAGDYVPVEGDYLDLSASNINNPNQYSSSMSDTVRLNREAINQLEAGKEYYIQIDLKELKTDNTLGDSVIDQPVYAAFTLPYHQDPFVFSTIWFDKAENDALSLNMEVSVNDMYKVMMLNTADKSNYFAVLYEIVNGNKIQKEIYGVDELLSGSTQYNFSYPNVENNKQYQLVLYSMIDKDYDGKMDTNQNYGIDNKITLADFGNMNVMEREQFAFYSSAIYDSPTSSGIGFGNQYAGANISDTTKITMKYDGALNLEKIDYIKYSFVYEDGSSINGEMTKQSGSASLFVSRGSGMYELNLPDSLPKLGKYNITIQYYQYDSSQNTNIKVGSYSGNYVY